MAQTSPLETSLCGPPEGWVAPPLVCVVLLVATRVVCQDDPGRDREQGVAILRGLSAEWLRPHGLRPRAARAVGLAFLHHLSVWILALIVTHRQLAGSARETAMARRRLCLMPTDLACALRHPGPDLPELVAAWLCSLLHASPAPRQCMRWPPPAIHTSDIRPSSPTVPATDS